MRPFSRRIEPPRRRRRTSKVQGSQLSWTSRPPLQGVHLSLLSAYTTGERRILADIHGHNFACRIDSGADDVAISATIVKFLGDNFHFLPTLLPTDGRSLKAVDGHAIQSLGQVQISPKPNTVAGPCRLRNKKAHVMPCDENSTVDGASCPCEIILGIRS